MLRSEFREYTDLNGRRDIYLSRLRVGLNFRVSPEISVFVQPQFAKTFGNLTYRPVSEQKNQRQTTSGIFYDPDLWVHQAYLSYWLAPSLEFKGGRQTLSYGDELLIGGGLGWQLYGRSFDALKWVWKHDLGSVDLFGSRLVGTDVGISALPQSNTDLFGLYSQWKLGESFREVDVYYFYYVDEVFFPGLSVNTIGSRLKSTLGRWNYRIEADYQNGTLNGTPREASQIDLEAGFLVIPSLETRVSLGAFSASKDYNQLFPAAHRWIGTADVFGRRNIAGAVVKATARVYHQISYQAEFFRLMRNSAGFPVYQLAGTIPIRKGAETDSLDLGSELDQAVRFEVSKNTILLANFSIFFPSGSYMEIQFGEQKPVYASLELNVNF